MTKPLGSFHKCKQRPDGHKVYCKRCTSEKQLERRQRDYERVRAVEARSRFKYKDAHSILNRIGYLRRQYGMTLEDYNMLLASQAGSCAACGADVTDGGRNAHVDHDHTTGRVRGILCHSCNVSLGLLNDDPVRVRALLVYVEAA